MTKDARPYVCVHCGRSHPTSHYEIPHPSWCIVVQRKVRTVDEAVLDVLIQLDGERKKKTGGGR